MQRTQEEYRIAVANAVAAGDNEAAEFLAKEAFNLYGKYKAPSPEEFIENPEPKLGYPDISVPPVPDALAKFPEEVLRRRERMLGGYQGPAPISTAAVGVSQAMRTGGELVAQGANLLIPDALKEGAEEYWDTIKEAPVIKQAVNALNQGFNQYNEWAKENPSEAEKIETAIDIGVIFSPSKKIDLADKAEKARLEYNTRLADERMAGIDKLMNPSFVGEQGFPEDNFVPTGGLMNRTVYLPTEKEKQQREALATIDKLNPNSHFAEAASVVKEEIEISSRRLEAFIQKAGNPTFNPIDFKKEMEAALAKMSDDAGYIDLSAEAQKKAKEYADAAIKILEKAEPTALGLWQARRDFDKFITLNKSDLLEDPVRSAKSIAGLYIRSVMNDKLKQITPGEVVHEQFDRLHHLYQAKSRLNYRKIGEADNRIGRMYQKIANTANLPTTPLALYATLRTGASIAAAGAAGLTVGLGAGASVYLLVEGLKKKTRLKFYTTLLSGLDKTIKAYQSDKNLVKDLTADKAYIIYLLNETRQQEDENGE